MSNVFQGTSNESRDAAMNVAFSMAMASVSNLPKGTRYHIVIEGCDADSGGSFTATARLVILEEVTEEEAPTAEADRGDAEKQKKKEELKQRLEIRGIDTERLEEDGLDLDTLQEILDDQHIADEMVEEWLAAASADRQVSEEPIHTQAYQAPEPPEVTQPPHEAQPVQVQEPPVPQPDEEEREPEEDNGIYMPPVLTLKEETALKEKISAEIKTILEEYMMEKVINIISNMGTVEKPDLREELQRIKEITTRELVENIIGSVFRLGGPVEEQKQSLALRMAENMILDGVIDNIWKDYEPEPSQDKKKKPHADTLDLVA